MEGWVEARAEPAERAGEAGVGRDTRRPQWWLFGTLGLLTALALVLLFGAGLNTKVARGGSPACDLVLERDDLVHLAEGTPAQVGTQLARWQACDPGVIGRARTAVSRDYLLIAVIGLGLGLAVWRVRQRPRWRLAGTVAGLITVGYVVADVLEDIWLDRVLVRGVDGLHSWLRWVSAIKFGAVGGALPVVVIAVALATSGPEGPHPRRPPTLTAIWRFLRRWWRRLLGPRLQFAVAPGLANAPAETPDPGLGICCSGGGVRSAAFNLGALQALDDQAPAELERASWLSAVSGGAYLAAAWVTARAKESDAWSRRSFEEDHLRRHASYLAPGLGGKLWALSRFFLGFSVNLVLVGLSLVVVFLPAGWAISSGQDPEPIAGGTVELPLGACLLLDDGTTATAFTGARARLIDGDGVRVEPSLPPRPPKPSSAAQTHTAPAGTGSAAIGLPAPTCPPTAEAPAAAPFDGPPAGTDNLVLAAGTGVELRGGGRLRVDAGGALACLSGGAGSPCTKDHVVVLPSPSLALVESAPQATLVLEEPAIVMSTRPGEFLLRRPCGPRACQEFILWDGFRWSTWILLGLAGLLGLVLVSVRLAARTALHLEKWVRRTLVLSLALVGIFFAFPWLVVWAEQGRGVLEDKVRPASGAGIGLVAATLLAQASAFTAGSASGAKKIASLARRLGTKVRAILLRIVGAVVGPLLILVLSIGIASFAAQYGFEPSQLQWWLLALGLLAFLGSGTDLNQWSMHPFYKERLRSAYAAERPASFREQVKLRTDRLSELKTESPNKTPLPKLLICAAANLADDRITAPGRPVVSWVFSRSAIGSNAIAAATESSGIISPAGLADDPRWRHLAEVWTAVAVSGAAFSPAMGKMSRPERFLLALGNLRLGVWYPNPRYWCDPIAATGGDPPQIDRQWYALHHPRPWYLAKEALGIHKLHDPWVYVTDGGHYENLGLVELLRRGACEIYCFDASGDTPETFGTLSDAMRLAREELGIEVDIRPGKVMKPDADGISQMGVWAGDIRYPDGTQGWLVIAKLAVPVTAPFDIIDLARTLPSFPNHPTLDQLYTDQKFEAYRALGYHLSQQAAELGPLIRRIAASGVPMKQAVNDAIHELCSRKLPDPCPEPKPAPPAKDG